MPFAESYSKIIHNVVCSLGALSLVAGVSAQTPFSATGTQPRQRYQFQGSPRSKVRERVAVARIVHRFLDDCWSGERHDVKKAEKQSQKAVARFNYDEFLASIEGEHFNTNQLVERAMKFSDLSQRTIYAKFLPELKRRLVFDPKYKTYSVSLFPAT